MFRHPTVDWVDFRLCASSQVTVLTATGIICAKVSLSHHVPSLNLRDTPHLCHFLYIFLVIITLFLDLKHVQSASFALQPKENKVVSFAVFIFENAKNNVK